MKDNNDSKQRNPKIIIVVVLCIFVFGMFMAIRGEFEQSWIRTAIAGLAGMALGVALSLFNKYRSGRK